MPCRVIIMTVKNGSQCLPYLFFYSHLQLHSSVQVNPNLKHLHLPRHSDLQPHLASCSQLCATGAFAVQNNPHCSPIFFHPQSAVCFWLTLGCLIPYAACLICSTLSVLKQSCSCWRNGLIWPLLSGKHAKSSLIYTNSCA